MNQPVSENPAQPTNAQNRPPFDPWRRWRREVDYSIRSLGEYILPFFLAAMEASWVCGALIGLAGIGFLGSHTALVPFWGPLLVAAFSLWLFRRILQKEALSSSEREESEAPQRLLDLPGLRLMFTVVTLMAVCLVWLHIYSSTYFLLDPSWLLLFVNDLLSLNLNFYQAVLIIALVFYLCWRGMRIAQMRIETGHIFRQLWIGLLILLFAVLLRAGQTSDVARGDDITLLLLLPVFLYIALSAHALARLVFIRREHPVGLDGSTVAQERSLLGVITLVGGVLLILTLIGGSLFKPEVFTALQPAWQALGVAYDWLVRAFSEVAVIIVTPFFLLSQWWLEHFPASFPHANAPTGVQPSHGTIKLSPASPAVVLTAKILVPVLILLVVALLLYFALRRRRGLKIALKLKGGDIHESVWSWSLFWQQFRAFWRSLFRRFFPEQTKSAAQAPQAEEITGPPAMRTIREIYRALLQKAATRGHMRRRDETPHEFQQRLDKQTPELEPQLGLITEAYALTRYGGMAPNERELHTIRAFWNELDQKWKP